MKDDYADLLTKQQKLQEQIAAMYTELDAVTTSIRSVVTQAMSVTPTESASRSLIEATLKSLSDVIAGCLNKPLYLKAEHKEGRLELSQVEFLTVEELARLAKVEGRSVRDWIRRDLFPVYRPPGSGRILIALSDALAWLESGRVESQKH